MQPGFAARAGKRGGEPPSAQLRSDAINIARVLGILGIVYVHSRTGLSNAEMGRQPLSVYSISYWLFVEVFGRSSVPLLSVISGWLVSSSVTKRRYRDHLRNKAANLLAPMVGWNLITLFVIGVAVSVVNYRVDFVPVGLRLANETLNLTAPASLNYHTAFLRDIFICMLAAPFLSRAPNVLLWAVVAAALIWSIGGWEIYILLRPQILAFFVLGLLARRGHVGATLRRVPSIALFTAFALLAAAKVWTSMQGDSFHLLHPYAIGILENLLRVAAAGVYWRMALWLAASRLRATFLGIECYIFITFCSHLLIGRMIGAVQAKLMEGFGDPLWLLSFIMQPLIALAGAWLISHALLRFSPALAELLSGGRLTRARRVNERP